MEVGSDTFMDIVFTLEFVQKCQKNAIGLAMAAFIHLYLQHLLASRYFFALDAFAGTTAGAGLGAAATATTNFLILCGRTLP